MEEHGDGGLFPFDSGMAAVAAVASAILSTPLSCCNKTKQSSRPHPQVVDFPCNLLTCPKTRCCSLLQSTSIPLSQLTFLSASTTRRNTQPAPSSIITEVLCGLPQRRAGREIDTQPRGFQCFGRHLLSPVFVERHLGVILLWVQLSFFNWS